MSAEPGPYCHHFCVICPTYHLCEGWTLPGYTPPSGEVTSTAILWAVVSLLLLMLRRLPSSDKVWGWETFKHHEVLLSDIYFPSLPALPPPVPPPLAPLTGVESYQTKWHLRDWLGRVSHLCLEMVECPWRLIGSRWRLLPPIGLTVGLRKWRHDPLKNTCGPAVYHLSHEQKLNNFLVVHTFIHFLTLTFYL